MDHLKYPIGKYQKPEQIDQSQIDTYMQNIANLPQKLRQAVDGLSEAQLDTPYRPGGWTVRQVVHHLADSHINSYVRCKLALTEDNPTITPYFEDRWASLPDNQGPVAYSLDLLSGLHTRWVQLMQSLSQKEYAKTFIHPEHHKEFRMDEMLAIYSWHGHHHLGHILSLKEREGW